MPRRSVSIVVGLLLVAGCNTGGDDRPPVQDTTPATPHDLTRVDQARQQGAESAPVWFIMASDFQCPYCRAFHHDVWPRIEADYVRTGKIRVAFMNHPMDFHPLAIPAAEAAMCAGAQNKFWPMHDSLFANQEKWVKDANPAGMFAAFATSLGLDIGAWKNCMTAHATRAMVEQDLLRTKQIGISGTPSFVIGDSLAVAGLAPYGHYKSAIDRALARVGR
jgi:protein-disulfide isomerase